MLREVEHCRLQVGIRYLPLHRYSISSSSNSRYRLAPIGVVGVDRNFPSERRSSLASEEPRSHSFEIPIYLSIYFGLEDVIALLCHLGIALITTVIQHLGIY